MVAEVGGFQYILSLKDCIDRSVNNGNFRLGVFFLYKCSGIYGGLHGAAEFGGNADTDHRNARFGKGQEYLLIILYGRHGRFGVYPLFFHHLLIEVPDADFHIFFEIVCIIKGYIKRDDCNILFPHQFLGQIAGAVADNMKRFSHVKTFFV